MAETQGTAAGGLTLDQVNAAVAKAIEPIAGALKTLGDQQASLVKNQQVLADTLKQLPPAPSPAAAPVAGKDGAAANKPLTMEDVQKAIAGALSAQTSQQQTAQQRQQFIAANLHKDIPAEFHAAIGNDPSKWAEEAKAVQSRFESVVKSLGLKPESFGGAAKDGGQAPSQAPVDYSKLNPVQKIALGLKQAGPVPQIGAQAASAVATAPAAGAAGAGAQPATAAK